MEVLDRDVESTACGYTTTSTRLRERLGSVRLPDLTEDHVET
ncbi:hypothetical protein ACWDF1_18335 [Streptomyces coelicoflavus]|nr:hypothetical protein [Streptomyces olivaceus]